MKRVGRFLRSMHIIVLFPPTFDDQVVKLLNSRWTLQGKEGLGLVSSRSPSYQPPDCLQPPVD